MEGGTDQLAVSSSHQYRKVIKPLMERQRRARINSWLEELKELMENVRGAKDDLHRLEKADVLEVTVKHLRDLKSRGGLVVSSSLSSTETFRTGFSACAREVSRFLA